MLNVNTENKHCCHVVQDKLELERIIKIEKDDQINFSSISGYLFSTAKVSIIGMTSA